MALQSTFVGCVQPIRLESMSCEIDSVSPPSGPGVGDPRSIQSDHSHVHGLVVGVSVVVDVVDVVVVVVGVLVVIVGVGVEGVETVVVSHSSILQHSTFTS